MTIAETLLEDFDSEMAGGRKTLERIPEDTPGYKPHDKSMALGKLAMHIAVLPMFATYIFNDPGMDLANPIHPPLDLTFRTRDILLATFDASVNECRKAVNAATDEQMQVLWPFRFGEHIISNYTRSRTYRFMFFNHFIHHRAQLGVYLRLNNLPVPGLYGPSADEPF